MPFPISDSERNTGTIASKKLDAIVSDIRLKGYAVVEDLISIDTRNLLIESVLEDVERVRAMGQPTQHEKSTGQGHLQLGLRRYAPFVRTDLVANPLIECVVAAVLGRGAWLGFYSGNVNCPGSTYQPLHFDRPFSWKTQEDAMRDGQTWPPPTTTLSCSLALDEITEANGATEIYPGTHLETETANWTQHRVEDHPALIAKWAPPARMTIPAGGVCFRDPRMWHRGVPNTAHKPRPMIAATYHAEKSKHWRGIYMQDLAVETFDRLSQDPALRILDNGELGEGRLVFQSDVRAIFDNTPSPYGINRNVRFVDLPERVNHFLDAHCPGGARIIRSDIMPDGV
jgi:ectoine hydroxylase-related dioxygenase (phytanoyl-CoA dioxygenase family)